MCRWGIRRIVEIERDSTLGNCSQWQSLSVLTQTQHIQQHNLYNQKVPYNSPQTRHHTKNSLTIALWWSLSWLNSAIHIRYMLNMLLEKNITCVPLICGGVALFRPLKSYFKLLQYILVVCFDWKVAYNMEIMVSQTLFLIPRGYSRFELTLNVTRENVTKNRYNEELTLLSKKGLS
jgi:hypothetical protein